MQLGTTEAKVPLPLQGNPAIVIHADSGRKSRTRRLPQTRGSKVLFKEQPGAPELPEVEEVEAVFCSYSGEYTPSIAEIYIDFVVVVVVTQDAEKQNFLKAMRAKTQQSRAGRSRKT